METNSSTLNLKFNATIVDSIEKDIKMSIENVVTDTRTAVLATVLQYALWDDNAQRYGVSRKVAMDTIDKELETRDRFDLIYDVIERLVEAGFLPRTMDVQSMRDKKNQAKSMPSV